MNELRLLKRQNQLRLESVTGENRAAVDQAAQQWSGSMFLSTFEQEMLRKELIGVALEADTAGVMLADQLGMPVDAFAGQILHEASRPLASRERVWWMLYSWLGTWAGIWWLNWSVLSSFTSSRTEVSLFLILAWAIPALVSLAVCALMRWGTPRTWRWSGWMQLAIYAASCVLLLPLRSVMIPVVQPVLCVTLTVLWLGSRRMYLQCVHESAHRYHWEA